MRKPRSRTNDPDRMRSRVLDAAVELFQHNGYGETSVQDIVKAAGVTSGALHHHYATKKDLGLAVIRERVAKMVEEAWIAPVIEATNPKTGVTKAFQDIIGGLKEGAIVGCPLNNLALELAYAEPDFRTEIQAVFDHWQAALTRRFEQSRGNHTVAGLTASELATVIVASYSGAMTMAKSAQSSAPLNATLKFLNHLWQEAPPASPRH